ncbi:MAG: HDIG domain-containing protein [Acidobacteria bacterium]|nr:HDIG domain-containing protein [Acidobacteriota bacterium]
MGSELQELSRERAWALLCEYTQNPNLIKHALAVEAAMCAYARKFSEDEHKWGIVGLLHDFDYERYPDPPDHPMKGAEILEAHGYPDDIIHAIKSHAEYLGVPRQSLMDKTLFAVDELVGFVTAVALVRPSKNVADITVESVKKKFKDRAFARSVRREDIFTGAADLGVDLDAHIQLVIDAMKQIASELGLDGSGRS